MSIGGAKLAPLQHQAAPLRNKIMAALRNAVETGLLQPGARLVERDLCEQLNVSRTSLREALRELQADGLLAQTENRGLAVSVLSRREAEDAYRIRAVMEALAVEQFIERADEGDRKQLAIEGKALKQAYQSGVVPRIIEAKRTFYDRICSGAQNSQAFDIINRIVLRTSSLRSRSLSRKERQAESVKEIEAILEAINRRDTVAAKRAAKAHVDSAALSALPPEDADQTPPAARRRKAASAA